MLIIAAWGLAAAIGFRIARRLVGARVPRLMEQMMENVMPNMMDACFSQMSPERREFMLSHCRGMLDRMEAKYVRGEPEPTGERAHVT